MANATLRPNGQRDSNGTWFPWPDGADHYNRVNDASDGSFIDGKVNTDGVSPYKHFDIQSVALPAGAIGRTVTFFMRIGAVDGGNGFPSKQFDLNLYWGNWNLIAEITNSGGLYTTSSNPITVISPTINMAFTQAQLDDFWIFMQGLYSSNYATGDYTRLYDAWVFITYDVPPSTPSPQITFTPDYTDTTPEYQATVNDSDGHTVKARFEVYDSTGITLLYTFDSAFVGSGNLASVTQSPGLAVGQYKVRVKAICDQGLESGWSSLLDFKVTQYVSRDRIYLWTTYGNAQKDLIGLWNTFANNIKEFSFVWNTYENSFDDLSLKWNINTAWHNTGDGTGMGSGGDGGRGIGDEHISEGSSWSKRPNRDEDIWNTVEP